MGGGRAVNGNAPVALFVYSRLRHTKRTIDSLLANDLAGDTDLYVFSDGPKNERHAGPVGEVRSYIRTVRGFRTVTIVERGSNYGLARSVIDGIDAVLRDHERVIALEDDLTTSPYFLRFMNDALSKYEDDDRVISVHGYTYPVGTPLPETFFLRGADCWGWGTWRRGWALFEADGPHLLRRLEQSGLTRAFDMDGAYPYTRMLRRQADGAVDSWAVRWHASAFLLGKLTLYPGRSLVNNTGDSGSATHTYSLDAFRTDVADAPVPVRDIAVEEHPEAAAAVREFLRRSRPPLLQRILARINAMLRSRP